MFRTVCKSLGKKQGVTQLYGLNRLCLNQARCNTSSTSVQTTDSKAPSDPPLWKEEDGWVVLDPPTDSQVVEKLAKQEDWTNVHYMTRPDLSQQEKQWFREAYNSPTKLYPPEKFLLKRGGNVRVEYVRIPVGATKRQMIEKSFVPPEDEKDIAPFDLRKQWAWANKVLFGPQRDMKNFPSFVNPGQVPQPETAHKFVPRPVFDAMQPYSGVTGFYVLTVGGFFAAIAKGVLIVSYPLAYFYYFAILWGFTRLPPVRRFLDNRVPFLAQKLNDMYFHQPIQNKKDHISACIAAAQQTKDMIQQLPKLYDVQMENIDLQLENNYRDRLKEVYTEVRARLDCQLALGATKVELEKEHMINWITDQVVKNITPDLEKKNIQSCLAQLQSLSQTAKI
ncbi:ATP synthase F(0) complex subunit B1, mitochondrial-like isoform X1 [Saccostrea echinata]|uniref:ATP synthase F(0) complex subunit B1, mitochondrial-like isoform X1 n=1 Tax=Saccostrea echinata TaxID=191078 RepID=UPI002A81E30D|nr:ATP synthase F(0) complex subunit B1, mitochondrial-like isoform X1 [Saccostrea echinata]XP_061176207.1 ATP synthase F(0) complex subunit B1, mitochondrial-like isoform X1 [Saccostrea echinata]